MTEGARKAQMKDRKERKRRRREGDIEKGELQQCPQAPSIYVSQFHYQVIIKSILRHPERKKNIVYNSITT